MIIIQVYNMFHRQYLHAILMESAIGEEGKGIPANLIVNHQVRTIFIPDLPYTKNSFLWTVLGNRLANWQDRIFERKNGDP